jgi:hypothetical protein
MVDHSSSMRLSAREMVIACVAVLIVFALGVGANLRQSNGDAWTLGGDFVEFYTAGRILNDHQQSRLYDFALQEEIHRELVPDETSLRLPFLYAPFVAVIFRPLAWLSLRHALLAFLTVTLILYVGALALLNAQFGPCPPVERTLVMVGGLSFFPFLGYNLLGAQISVIGFTAIALALVADDRERPVLSGLALSVCLYKPSLLVLILPMLCVSRRFRHLLGFLAGAGLLTMTSIAVAGTHSSVEFLARLVGVARQSTTAAGLYNEYRYVDLNAFFRLLPYGRSLAGYMLLLVLAMAATGGLVRLWWRCRGGSRSDRLITWAATLTWTLVLNIYTPFYDSILVVAAAILAVAATRSREWAGWHLLARALLILYLVPWIAEAAARSTGLQLYTLALMGLGTLLILDGRFTQDNRSRVLGR